jgi:phosphoribosylaminoimidazole carboxylase PurE protein
MEGTFKVLKDLGVPFEAKITSAHRTPEATHSYVTDADQRGCGAFICAAGMAAHLAGAVSANTLKPVIGVPINASLDGLDALLSTVQMPGGIPVATVAIGKAGAKNAAYLAVTQGLNEARDQSESFKQRLSIQQARTRSITETQRLYRDQYLSLGTRSLLDLLNAEQEIHQSQFDKENTLYDLRSLQVDCLYSTARIREAFELNDRVFQGVSIEDE